jgi:hypothetical protein
MVRHDVPKAAATHELSMLGLAPGMVDALVQGYEARAPELAAAARRLIPRMPGVDHVSGKVVLSSSAEDGTVTAGALLDMQMDFAGPKPGQRVALTVSHAKLRALLAELVEARETLRV